MSGSKCKYKNTKCYFPHLTIRDKGLNAIPCDDYDYEVRNDVMWRGGEKRGVVMGGGVGGAVKEDGVGKEKYVYFDEYDEVDDVDRMGPVAGNLYHQLNHLQMVVSHSMPWNLLHDDDHPLIVLMSKKLMLVLVSEWRI